MNALLEDDFEDGDIIMQELLFCSPPRKIFEPKFQFQRLDLEYHLKMCHEKNGIQKWYHISEAAFMKLYDILDPDISVNKKYSRSGSSGNTPICSKTTLCVGLRFMGGEKTKTLADTFGGHTVSAQRCVNKFLDTVDQCDHPLLSTNRLPESPDELKNIAAEWMK